MSLDAGAIAREVSHHLLRGALVSVAVLAGLGAVSSGSGIAGALLGAWTGLLLGELGGRRELRGAVLAAGFGGMAILAVLGGELLVWTAWPARLLGTGLTLHVQAFAVHLGVAAAWVGGLRAGALRSQGLAALELGVWAALFAHAFAAHRGGAFARPLWLTDPVWRAGLDPADVLVVLGGLLLVVLAAVQITDGRRRASPASLLLLPLLAVFAVWFARIGVPDPLEAEDPLSALQDDLADMGRGGGEGEEPEDASDGGGDDARGGASPVPGEGEPFSAEPLGEGGDEHGEAWPADVLEQDGDGEGEGNPPVAVVILEDDYDPPAQGYYLRQDVHSELVGAGLSPTPEEAPDALRRFPTEPEMLEAPGKEGRKQVHGRVALLAPHAMPFALETPVAMEPLPNPEPTRFLRAWRFVSLAQEVPYEDLLGAPVGDPAWDDATWDHYTLAPDDPRYRELARSIVASLPPSRREDPFARALAVKLWLDEEMTYSLDERHEGADDPTAAFLFGNRIGYCVHSAHATVYLWRALGLPARMGTGYHVDSEARRGSVLPVTARDAHAWPEIFVRDVGWVVLDIAPSETLDPLPEPLDDELVRLLGEMARQDGAGERLVVDVGAMLRALAWAASVVMGGLLAVVVFLHHLVKAWRRGRPWLSGPHALPRVAYRAALDQLAEVGWRRQRGESREAFAARVGGVLPSFGRLTELHLAARLGDPHKDAPPHPEIWWELGRSIRREARAVVPWWRRWLGLLNPFSIYGSR